MCIPSEENIIQHGLLELIISHGKGLLHSKEVLGSVYLQFVSYHQRSLSKVIQIYNRGYKIYALSHELPTNIGNKKMRKYWKNFKNRWRQSEVSSLTFINKTLALVVKDYAKTDILDTLINFARDCRLHLGSSLYQMWQEIFLSKLVHGFLPSQTKPIKLLKIETLYEIFCENSN